MASFSANSNFKPIRKKRLRSPNDHILTLVRDWYNDAKANNAQTVHSYKKALKSLEKYPLRLETGADCRILYGFGEKICQMIDQHLKTDSKSKTISKTKSMNDFGSTQTSIGSQLNHIAIDDPADDDKNDVLPLKPAKYNPTSKTIKKTLSAGPTLFHNPTTTAPATTTSAISTLLGITDNSIGNMKASSSQSVQILRPGSFDILLCVDNAEASRSTQKVLLEHLKKNSIKFDVRKLNIGDFLWIVRPKDKDIQIEAILDYIVERKRLDDLSKSIIDGRYNEQKFRLKQCGISNLIYLVESLKNPNTPGILTASALNQAVVNTQVVEDFFVREVSNPIEMASYLVMMTKHLMDHFQTKTLHVLTDQDMSNNYKTSFHDENHYVMPFESFNSGTVKSKPPTVKDMFARALMQIAGMSIDNVLALTEVYPTPTNLFEAYSQCANDKERQLLLSSIKKVTSNRKLGKVMSSTIDLLFNSLSYQ